MRPARSSLARIVWPALLLSALACNLSSAPFSLSPAPSTVASPTGAPETLSPPTPTSQPAAHRIAVRITDGLGEFYDAETGARFVPRGMNYARVDHIVNGGHWHSTFDPLRYDPALMEAALRRMEADGYNVVRVFVDCCSAMGQQVGDHRGGLNPDYMQKVVDFLERARAHHIFVLLSVDLTPGEGGYNDPLWKALRPEIDGENARYLTFGGLQAKKHYMTDFVQALLDLHAPLDAIFAYDLTNEVHFDASMPPLSLTSGKVSTGDGHTYDMGNPDEKEQMVNENLIYWIDHLRASIRELDPTALVTVSFFVPQAPVPTRIGDNRYIVTKEVIARSQADFIDLHPYPGWGLTLPQYARNFGISLDTQKPVIIGEFGAGTTNYRSAAIAAQVLRDWQVESCKYGFDGWLLWTWDTEETQGFWNALSADGAIEKVLAPANRPDPCKGSP